MTHVSGYLLIYATLLTSDVVGAPFSTVVGVFIPVMLLIIMTVAMIFGTRWVFRKTKLLGHGNLT